jgi:hypothetical protein
MSTEIHEIIKNKSLKILVVRECTVASLYAPHFVQ